MDKFKDGHRVWLRSRAHGTYLYANEDGRSVSLHTNPYSVSAAWVVHLLFRKTCSYGVLLLHSDSYGRYLAATGTPASRGHRVGLLDFDDMNDFDIRWFGLPSTSSEYDILLRHMYSRGNLSVCSKRWFKNRGSTLQIRPGDKLSAASQEMLWMVEDIPSDLLLPPQRQRQLPRELGMAIRTVRVSLPNKDECRVLLFMGNSLLNLKCKLHGLVGSGHTAYVRAGNFGRLTKLLVDLPSSNEDVDLVLLPNATDGEIDIVRAKAITPLAQVEWGGVGLSVGNMFHSNSKQKSNPASCKQVWIVGSAEEAQHAILQWVSSGRPEDSAATVEANIRFKDMKSVMEHFQQGDATILLKRLADDYADWMCEYIVLASITHLPHPPKEVVSRFGSAVPKNNGVLQPWIMVDM